MDILKPLKWLKKTLSENFNAPPHNGQPKEQAQKSPHTQADYERLYEELTDRPTPRR